MPTIWRLHERVWSSRREVALDCVKRLGAAPGAGEDEGTLERGQQHRRLLAATAGGSPNLT
jgi:hypothetical protein